MGHPGFCGGRTKLQVSPLRCAPVETTECGNELELVDADVFVPEVGAGGDEVVHHGFAFGGVEVVDFDAEGAEFFAAAGEGAGLADDDSAEAELSNEAGAIESGG